MLLGLVLLAGCVAADGPIKTYDEKSVKDTSKISILYLPPAVDIVEVDGEEYETPFIEQGFNEVHLLPGQHILSVKYVQYWGDVTSGNLVKSSPVIFNLNTKGNEKLYLKYDIPKDEWQAQRLAGRFKPWIENKDNKGTKVKGSQYYSRDSSSDKGMTALGNKVVLKNPLTELKFWWEQASYDEKQIFKKWLEE